MTNEIRTGTVDEPTDAEVIITPPPALEDASNRTLPVKRTEPATAGRAATEILLPAQRRDELKAAWVEVQSSFIDEPADAVRRADGLVKDVLKAVSERFEAGRRDLENEWSRGGEAASTESLRLAIRRYRTLFDRLLGI
jgi:hypothetical protein